VSGVNHDYLSRIGTLIRDARKHRGWTQQQLADVLNTSQSAVNRIERGHQNLTFEMIARIGEALDNPIVQLGAGPTHLRVTGPTTLSGSIDVKTSKNAGVALLCAALLNRGRTTLRRVAKIEEVHRLLEVLESIGVRTRWLNADNDLEIVPPANLDLAAIDAAAARRTRSIIMFLGPLMHRDTSFELPYAGGCDLGKRTVEPHLTALRPFGLEVAATDGSYHARVHDDVSPQRPIVLTERGDTVTENALMAAALHQGTTVIRNASSNYMVQDLCFFLEKLGVKIDGIGTTTLTVVGCTEIEADVDYHMNGYQRSLWRSKGQLNDTLASLDDHWRNLSAHGQAEGLALVGLRETAAMTATARWCTAAALARDESRGIHVRVDAPGLEADGAVRLLCGGLDRVWTRPEIHQYAEAAK